MLITESEIMKNKLIFKGKIFNGIASDIIKDLGFSKAIETFDGEYSTAFYDGKNIFLARDILGIMPLFYQIKDGLNISLMKGDFNELNPREYLIYDGKKVLLKKRKFFDIKPKITEENIEKQLGDLFVESIKKRLSNKKIGLLFSGGLDSSLIAFILKKLNVDFTCYTAGFVEEGYKIPSDNVFSEKIANYFGLKNKILKVPLNKIEEVIKDVMRIIGEPDVIKTSIVLPFYFACKEAVKDGINVMFTGLGSEELFAGYKRHRIAKNINKECLSGLKDMYLHDTYRDFALLNHFNLKVEVPFLDKDLVQYSLRIPGKLKIKDNIEKYILRKAGLSLGFPEEFAFRKKVASQYGSRFMNAFSILSKRAGFKTKTDYANKLWHS
jgi:asparagine synthase (glutamine-hydrolysing)